jgi:hypothetical protein
LGELENRGINPAEFDQWLKEGIDFYFTVFQLDQTRKDEIVNYANQLLDEQNNEKEIDSMPEISRFFGIIITINYNDHNPPHFHVRYGSQKALISIENLSIIEGKLTPRVLGLTVEWAALHQSELENNWELARKQQPLQKIQPLD